MTPSSDPALRGQRIGLSYESDDNLFCRELVEGVREAAAARGAAVLAREYDNSAEQQRADIKELLAEGVNVLLISAADATVGPAIAEAHGRGVPVFMVDRTAVNCPIVSHITSDNLQGGRLAAEYLANGAGCTGEVAIVGFQWGGSVPGVWAASSIDERIRGFKEAIVDHADLHLVAEVEGGEKRESAADVTRRLLQDHPQLAAIFATNDVMVQGVLDAVREEGHEDTLVIVGYDATPAGCAEIMRDGPLRGEVAQFPTRIGHMAVELWAHHTQGMAVPERLDVPVELVTRDNVERFTGAERLLRLRHGEVWTAGERVVFFPVRAYQMMLNEIHAASPDLLRHIVYRSGFVLGESIAHQVRGLYPNPDDGLFVLLEDLARGGFGTFELVELDLTAGQATVRGKNLFESVIAPDLDWVRTPRCVDNYCSGRLAGYLSVIFRRPAACEEIKCEARGDAHCEFVISTRGVESPEPQRAMQ